MRINSLSSVCAFCVWYKKKNITYILNTFYLYPKSLNSTRSKK